MSTYLFQNRTTNGASAALAHPGGPALLIVRGTFGGATVTTQVSDDGTNWVDLQFGVFTSATGVVFELPINTLVRVSVSGATGTTSLTVAVN